MRQIVPLAGVILICSACTQYAPAAPMFSQIITQQDSVDPNCRDYSAQATIEGRPQVVVGRPVNDPMEVGGLRREVPGNRPSM